MKTLQQAIRENAELNMREETSQLLDYFETSKIHLFAPVTQYNGKHRKP